MSDTALPMVFPETGHTVRVMLTAGVPWWVAKDVCQALSIEKPDAALRGLDDDERDAHVVRTPGGPQRMSVINESGLYSMILRSRKPQAKEFKRWVTREVLPSIRRTGNYETVPSPRYEIPQTYSQALLLAASQAEELESNKKQIAELTPKAEAAEVYFASDKYLLVREAAKLLGVREKGLRVLLLEHGYIFRHKNRYGDAYFDVTAKYLDAGLFTVKALNTVGEDGGQRTSYTVYVTPRGVEAIRKVLHRLADKGNVAAPLRGAA